MSREQFRDKFQKEYRAENVAIESADTMADIQAIPTGILSFDTSTGIGGFPRGRIVEVFGPESGGKSLLTLIATAYAQRNFNSSALYLDIEGGTPREWLETLGINLENFDIIPTGLSAEQNMDAIIMAIEEKCYDYIIVDSVAGMVSSAELSGDIDKNYMAELARAMSKGLKKIVAILGGVDPAKAPACIFINQVREKPGVMYGCFHYDSRVVLADGTTQRIGEIVNKQLPVEVLSNCNGKIIPKKVIGWHRNGIAEKFLKFTVKDFSGAGRRRFLCTPNHLIRTDKNTWVAAHDIKINDQVQSYAQKILTPEHIQIITGSVLGGGSLLGNSHAFTGTYREDHCLKQSDYLKWKADLLEPLITQFVIKSDRVSLNSKSLLELGELRKKLYKNRKKIFTPEIAQSLNWLGIAIWFMDDGTFYKTSRGGYNAELCIAGYDNTSINNIRAFFAQKLGHLPYYLSKIRTIRFLAKERNLLFKKIAKFVPPCMQYKLSKEFQGQFIPQSTIQLDVRNVPIYTQVLDIETVTNKPSMQKFDITVADSHNYFINNVNVHNSPETTPGGRALKFYSSQRFRVTKKSQSEVTEAGDIAGHAVVVKNVKNKLGPPKREGEFFIHYTKGVDITKSIMTMAKQRGLYEKQGQKYILHLDVDMPFDTVGSIKEMISSDLNFQTKVYNFLMQNYIGKMPAIKNTIDEFENEFK